MGASAKVRKVKRGKQEDKTAKPNAIGRKNRSVPTPDPALEEDEDIDDDLAFNDEDEAIYGEYFASSGKQSTKSKDKEDDEEEDAGATYVDLEQLLDDINVSKDEHSSKTSNQAAKSSRHRATKKHKEDVIEDTRGAAKIDDLANAVWSQLSDKAKERVEKMQKHNVIRTSTEIAHKDEAEDRTYTRESIRKRLKSWDGVVKRLRTADHVQFPLRSANAVRGRHTGTTIASPIAAVTPLERRIAELMEDAGLSVKSSTPDPDAGMEIKFVDPTSKDHDETNEDDNVLVSGSYLAKLKAVMSYNLLKRKRQNKIRSKSYHRQMRKEKEKLEEKRLRELHETDPKAAMEKRRQKLEKLRAIERVTMKHKNTSKWVRHVKRAAKWDEGVRSALGEEQRLHQKLMTKAQESAFGPSDSDSEDSESGAHASTRAGESRIDTLLAATQADPSNPFAKSRMDLLKMGFMKAAEQKRELARLDSNEEENDVDNEIDIDSDTSEGTSKKRKKPIQRTENDTSMHVRQKFSGPPSGTATTVQLPVRPDSIGMKMDSVTQGEQVALPTETKKKRISFAPTTKEVDGFEGSASAQSTSLVHQAPPMPTSDLLQATKPIRTREQVFDENYRLVQEAFADDDVLQDLQKEKDEALEIDATPIDKNLALPGWDEWGGLNSGTNKRQKERLSRLELKRKAELDLLRQKRRDATLAHVFINDNVDTIPEKLDLKTIPYPYETVEQYQRAMRMPLGKEWNTELTVRQVTRPKVVVKKGVIVDPLNDGVRKKHAPRTRLQIKQDKAKLMKKKQLRSRVQGQKGRTPTAESKTPSV